VITIVYDTFMATAPNGRTITFSSRHSEKFEDYPLADVDRDPVFSDLFELCRSYTMTSKEAMFALYQAIAYVVKRNIPGDFVECGVWQGGSALLAALALARLGGPRRRIWMYDTFVGMTAPSPLDIDISGTPAQQYMDQYSDDGKWCYADLESVKQTFSKHAVPESDLEFVPGDVVQTLRERVPQQIAVLRLDTDWYESTRSELEILYPLLSTGGVLIVDDYGHWDGSRKAVDEFFADRPLLLNRVNYSVRVAIKN
jgi:O-methyltransferase